MNDFIKDKSSIGLFIVSKGSKEHNNKSLKDRINKLFPPKEKTERFNIIYVYSLQESSFKYPNDESNVLYIGQTEEQQHKGKKDLGFRFMHCKNGEDNKQNICLSQYYDSGETLVLELYEASDKTSDEEARYRYDFLNKYGALPIAEGASYNKSKLIKISNIIEEI